MIEKKTIVDRIEVGRDGIVGVRFAILILEDGVEIGSRWHRAVIEPGGDVDAQIAAVNADITVRPDLKAEPVDLDRVPLIKAVCDAAHKPAEIAPLRVREL